MSTKVTDQQFDQRTYASFMFGREVRLTDTDASGFAEFASIVRMMEETEYAFLRSRGLSVVLYDDRGTLGFPRLSTTATVHEPLCFGDLVQVHLKLTQIDGKQIHYRFDLHKQKQLVAEGHFVVACCRFPDHQLPYAILIPDDIINALKSDNPRNSTISAKPNQHA